LNDQSAEVQALQFRLEKLVSNRAASAARDGSPSLVGGHLTDVALYFSDVRDFTSYAEAHRPEQVVELLNRLISIQVAIIDRYDGDVDKIIGDAVLAVFTGADRAARAIACAQEVLTQCAQFQDLPRKLAIGVHDGAVVAGVIGAVDRQDYTVIGDAVNVSQRLCTLAEVNQLVSDIYTLQRGGHPEAFGAIEEQTVKGRQEALRVRRWTVTAKLS
jgi:class 3 adenylate cyclase